VDYSAYLTLIAMILQRILFYCSI